MFVSCRTIYIVSLVFAALSLVMVLVLTKDTPTVRTLTRDDLPSGAVFVAHVHPGGEMAHDENGEPTGEMEHYATPDAIKNGGPIYGVYGYVIVSIEYEVPESKIGLRMVGKEFPGWGLAPSFFGLTSNPPYDHFHVGLKEENKNATSSDRIFLVHFMLLPHAEELKLGLSCG